MDPSDAGLSDRLRLIMAHRGLTQEKMADICGISKSSLEKYLAGSPPSGTAIKKICAGLGLSADYLLFGIDPATEVPLIGVQSIVFGAVHEGLRDLRNKAEQTEEPEQYIYKAIRDPRDICFRVAVSATQEYLQFARGEREIVIGAPVPIKPKA